MFVRLCVCVCVYVFVCVQVAVAQAEKDRDIPLDADAVSPAVSRFCTGGLWDFCHIRTHTHRTQTHTNSHTQVHSNIQGGCETSIGADSAFCVLHAS